MLGQTRRVNQPPATQCLHCGWEPPDQRSFDDITFDAASEAVGRIQGERSGRVNVSPDRRQAPKYIMGDEGVFVEAPADYQRDDCGERSYRLGAPAVLAIRAEKGRLHATDAAEKFDLKPETIRKIWKGITYKHVK